MAEAWRLPGQQPHWDVEMPTLTALSQSQTPASAQGHEMSAQGLEVTGSWTGSHVALSRFRCV